MKNSLSSISLDQMLGYLETEKTAEENKVYDRFKPQETLGEHQNLINSVRKDLERGIVLPVGSSLKIYKSKQDPTADPVSAVIINKGLKTSAGNKPEIEFIDSDLHVFTRLDLRNSTEVDKANQPYVFDDILNRILNQ